MSDFAGLPDARVPATPVVAASVFGDRVELAERYVRLLATTGIDHGLIGPREAPRLWDRHVLNAAVTALLFSPDATVADIGSGAGLPGLPLALARPDLSVTLVEPLLRRTRWLSEVVADLGLVNVEVRRARAEDLWGSVRVRHVTSRAVAALDRLAAWCLPLCQAHGSVLALKGEAARAELHAAAPMLPALGAVEWEVLETGAGVVEPPTRVVRILVGESPDAPSRARSRSARSPARGAVTRQLRRRD